MKNDFKNFALPLLLVTSSVVAGSFVYNSQAQADEFAASPGPATLEKQVEKIKTILATTSKKVVEVMTSSDADSKKNVVKPATLLSNPVTPVKTAVTKSDATQKQARLDAKIAADAKVAQVLVDQKASADYKAQLAPQNAANIAAEQAYLNAQASMRVKSRTSRSS